VRIDIFVHRGEPGACSINEISLSSGGQQHGHRTFMGRLWAEPLLNNEWRSFHPWAVKSFSAPAPPSPTPRAHYMYFVQEEDRE
jgi:hypothetical protein